MRSYRYILKCDGDCIGCEYHAERPDDEAYKNAYFVNANASSAPGIVNVDFDLILSRSMIYSDVYGRMSITF